MSGLIAVGTGGAFSSRRSLLSPTRLALRDLVFWYELMLPISYRGLLAADTLGFRGWYADLGIADLVGLDVNGAVDTSVIVRLLSAFCVLPTLLSSPEKSKRLVNGVVVMGNGGISGDFSRKGALIFDLVAVELDLDLAGLFGNPAELLGASLLPS